MSTLVLFPNDALKPKTVDFLFQEEEQAARKQGFSAQIFDFNALVFNNDPEVACMRIPAAADMQLALYRGYMMTVDQYSQLFEELKRKNIILLTQPEEYAATHLLPNWYPLVQKTTPETIILSKDELDDVDSVYEHISAWANQAAIVKDYVKSRKHEWDEACFIPNVADKQACLKVIKTFITRQGNDLAGGLVLRKFLDLQKRSLPDGTIVPVETRCFIFHHKLLLAYDRWGHAQTMIADPSWYEPIFKAIPSPFFSLDIAQQTNGQWSVIEAGDGQVSGLPDGLNPDLFYGKLRAVLHHNEHEHSAIEGTYGIVR
jgi:ATP-grasp domain, R2K clade family 3